MSTILSYYNVILYKHSYNVIMESLVLSKNIPTSKLKRELLKFSSRISKLDNISQSAIKTAITPSLRWIDSNVVITREDVKNANMSIKELVNSL